MRIVSPSQSRVIVSGVYVCRLHPVGLSRGGSADDVLGALEVAKVIGGELGDEETGLAGSDGEGADSKC
jgi:hypothetical protein